MIHAKEKGKLLCNIRRGTNLLDIKIYGRIKMVLAQYYGNTIHFSDKNKKQFK